MSIVNVRGQISNAHTLQTIGGRGAANWVLAELEAATGAGRRSVRVRLECQGPGLRPAERRRKGGDQRRAVLTVEVPAGPADQWLSLQFRQGDKIIRFPLDLLAQLG